MAKWLLIALAIPVVLLALHGIAPAEGGITVTEAAAMIKGKKDLQLIDVRTPDEFSAGHLANAKSIPLQDIGSRLGEIDKSKPVLLYCRSGHRSGKALEILVGKGFTDARHMAGGIVAWQAAGLPVTH
jgi:rhodanese-related sulfurtransferase